MDDIKANKAGSEPLPGGWCKASGRSRPIRRRTGQAFNVHVVVVTSGDGFPEGVEMLRKTRSPRPSDFRNYGKLRERETVAAMSVIGVPRRDITFLGFPDGGLCLIASQYLRARGASFESPFTEREQPPRDTA